MFWELRVPFVQKGEYGCSLHTGLNIPEHYIASASGFSIGGYKTFDSYERGPSTPKTLMLLSVAKEWA